MSAPKRDGGGPEYRVLVTGATGFIGGEVVRELARHGHEVVAFVRDPAKARRLGVSGDRIRTAVGDLADRASLETALVDCDAVVHLGALVDPALVSSEADVVRVNRDLAVELGELARAARVRRFVFASSIAAMGFWSGMATSESPCRPVSAYGRSKLEAERGLSALARPDFDVVVLRLPTVYGPGERYNFLELTRAVDRGVFRLIGDGRNVMPLCTTENAARTARGAVEGRLRCGVYLVADAEPYSMARIHRALCSALGKRRPRVRLPKPLALVAGALNQALAARVPAVPSLLTPARVRTLTVDQPFDVRPLLGAGIALDARLEHWVRSTVEDYRRRGELDSARDALTS